MALADFEKKIPLSNVSLETLIKEFIKDEIHFAVLYGSFARGLNQRHSDIDIALFSGKTKQECFKLQLKYASKFEIIDNKKIDIVILDYASLLLSHNVIKDGILIFENTKNENSYNCFKEYVISRFPDFYYTIMSQLKQSLGK